MIGSVWIGSVNRFILFLKEVDRFISKEN